jgi:hypothetical protein
MSNRRLVALSWQLFLAELNYAVHPYHISLLFTGWILLNLENTICAPQRV